MKILITGGAGFIGSHFVDFVLNLAAPGDEVMVVDKLTYAGNIKNLHRALEDPRFRFLKFDISSPLRCGMAFGVAARSEGNIDYLFHFAAESHVDRSIAELQDFMTTNVMGTQFLLEAARRFSVGRFIQISTDEVYGSLPPPIEADERSTVAPGNPYAATKAAADALAYSYFHTYSVPVIITRSTNNYGSRQFPEKLLPVLIGKALNGEPLPIYGDGQYTREWLHVADNIRGIWQAATCGKVGEIYNIGSGVRLTNEELAKKIITITGSTSELVSVPDRLGHDRRYAVSSEKMKKELGWAPTHILDVGLKQAIEWYKAYPDYWR